MACACKPRGISQGTIPAPGSANQNGTQSLGGNQPSGMTKSGFCMKCFSFWFWVAVAIVTFWVLTEKK